MFTTVKTTTTKTTPDFEKNRQLILKLDPLVGDTACHVRTAYLFYLYQKTTPLTSTEITFLNNCTQLPALSLFDAFGFTVQQTSPKGKIAKFKSQVATASLDFLTQNMPVDFFEPDSILSKRLAIDFVGHDIPVYPFFTSVKMLLNFLIARNIPIIVNLKRLKISTDSENKYYQLLGTSTLLYRYDTAQQKYCYVPVENDDPTVGVIFDFYSTLNEENVLASTIPEFFSQKDYLQFLAGFQKLAIDKLILMCAAAHCQLPNAIMKGLPTGTQATYAGLFRPSRKCIHDLMINPNTCHIKEFRRVFAMSNHYGFAQPDCLLISKQGRTALSIPFMVDHTYLGTFKESYLRMETLFATQQQTTIMEANKLAAGVAP